MEGSRLACIYTLRNYLCNDMDSLHPISFWHLVARLDMDIYPQNKCFSHTRDKQHIYFFIFFNNVFIAQKIHVLNAVTKFEPALLKMAYSRQHIYWKKNLSIEYGFPNGTRLMGNLRIHLMISLECNATHQNYQQMQLCCLCPLSTI